MDITMLPEQSREVITAEPWRAIENALDYGWAVPGDDVISSHDLMAAKNEILSALFNANTPALDRVLAAMAAHDPEMEDTNL